LLWVGIECDLPPPADGGEVDKVLENELIELFLDNAGGRRMSYHLGLKPSGLIGIPGVATSAVPDYCQCAVTRRPSGYTIELRLQLDAFDQLGLPNRERIGFNMARDSVKRWASLNGVIGQGQRPEQFWTLLLGDGGTEKPPAPAYRPLFREGTDLMALATNVLAGWEDMKGRDFAGKPLMEVRMRQLAATVAKSRKDRWGAVVPLRAALYRGWRAQKDLLPQSATSTVARAVEAALLPGVNEAFPEAAPSPPSGWRECAIVSSDDGSAQPYALFVPAGIPPGKRLALVVYLHGSGMGSFSDGLILERHQPAADFLIARVNARRCGRYHEVEKREIGEVINDIAAHWPVDTNRVSLLGFSAGAFAVGELAVEQPGRFSAIAAVAGRFTTLGRGQAPALPVTAVWGMADPVVPFAPAEAAALHSLVTKSGNEVSLYALPATDHAVPMAGLEYWLASKSRGGITMPAAPLSKEQQLETLYAEGKEAAKAKDWVTAEAKWKAALSLDPQSWEVLNHYAWFLVDTVPPELRNPDRALGMAGKANELTEGKNRDILDTLAEIWFQKKDYARAVEFSRKSLEPGLQGHSGLKSLQRQLAKFEKALADATAGVEKK
jgi:dienelactone hydrolase